MMCDEPEAVEGRRPSATRRAHEGPDAMPPPAAIWATTWAVAAVVTPCPARGSSAWPSGSAS